MLLYIHIPFCDSKCSYCSFNSYVDKFSFKKEYMNALYNQLRFEIEYFKVSVDNPIETVFIGGGTPSTIDPILFAPIFSLIGPYLKKNAEITSEANPNSATKFWLQGMYHLGVNRLSFGVQSFNEPKLKQLGRSHNSLDAINAVTKAFDVGYKNISIDLIYGVFGDSKELLHQDLHTAFSLPINHLSLYALTIEKDTPFEKKPDMAEEQLETTQWLFDRLKENQFYQYEISNFGEYQSEHNLGYWQYKDYIGIGSGAVGFLKNMRYYPNKNIEEYIKNPLQREEEILSKEDQLTEKIFLGLRSCIGINANLLDSKQLQQANMLAHEGLLFERNGVFLNKNYLLRIRATLMHGYWFFAQGRR